MKKKTATFIKSFQGGFQTKLTDALQGIITHHFTASFQIVNGEFPFPNLKCYQKKYALSAKNKQTKKQTKKPAKFIKSFQGGFKHMEAIL